MNPSETDADGRLIYEDITIVPKTKDAFAGSLDLKLTPNEYSLITYLIMNKDRAVSRTELLDRLWGYESLVETRVADDTVKRLRKKIESTKVNIKTVWGYGFRLTAKEPNERE